MEAVPPEIKKKVATVSASIKLPIVTFHYVEYVQDPKDTIRKSLDIVPSAFEFQLKALHDENYTSYFVREIPDILTGKKALSPKSIILTFDDGYEDFYDNAFPLLKKYQIKGTIYLIVDFIGRKGFLNEKEIKEIAASGLVEIGAHSLDHLYLKTLPEQTVRKQVFESKKKLEDTYGININTFAYPYGAFSQQALDLVKEAGYTAAVSTIPGIYQSENNLMFLSRIRSGYLTVTEIKADFISWKK